MTTTTTINYFSNTDLPFYVPFNSISVKSGQWMDDNERLCALMEPCADKPFLDSFSQYRTVVHAEFMYFLCNIADY